ncbi:hypothetical protein ACLKMY_10625 [Paraburkholderia mimosarum]|uniref:hypothetical protein n=1 Tax=Paraburkholderia mimosarum TaxID=312026 RepID=UPI0039C263A6
MTPQTLCARIKAVFFPVLRVDLASVGDLPRIRRQPEPAPTALAGVMVFPRQKTHDVRPTLNMTHVTGSRVCARPPHEAHKKGRHAKRGGPSSGKCDKLV